MCRGFWAPAQLCRPLSPGGAAGRPAPALRGPLRRPAPPARGGVFPRGPDGGGGDAGAVRPPGDGGGTGHPPSGGGGPGQAGLHLQSGGLSDAAGAGTGLGRRFCGSGALPCGGGRAFTVPLAFFRETAPEQYVYALQPDVPGDFPYETVGIPADYRWARGRVEVPIWYWQGHAVWGMTARLTQDIVRHLE